ncbi:hypothetical protein [Treponema sp. R80B11-R83G3]
MKKLTAFFIFVILISFVSCDTVTHYTLKVSVDRNPTLIIENRTGYPVIVNAPVSSNITNGASTQFQPTETRGTINVTYRIGPIQFTEQATMNNADVTVTLTKRPPIITVINQTGQQVSLTAPVAAVSNINSGEKTEFLAPALNQVINITYRIGQVQFTEQAIMDNADVTVTLTKSPLTLTVINQTGYQVFVTTPISSNIDIGARTGFLVPPASNIDITYSIGQAQYTEKVTMRNENSTVTLTKKPAMLTIVNNVGATINTIFLRTPGSPTWVGGNIVIRGGTVQLAAAGGAQTGDISGSIVNRDSMKIWLGNIPISGNVFDIRIDDVQTNTYVKSNVQVNNDMTLTFTQADKR